MAYIQERKDKEGKTHYRVQIRLRGQLGHSFLSDLTPALIAQEKVSGSLQVSNESLRRHLRSRNKNRGSAAARFVPITVTSHPSIQLHVKGQLSITIDFDRSKGRQRHLHDFLSAISCYMLFQS